MHPEHKKVFWRNAGYEPNPQQRAVLEHPRRIKVLSGGERSGKTKSAAMWAIGQMFSRPKLNPQPEELGWIVAKHYELTRFSYDYIGAALKANGVLQEWRSATNPGLIKAAGNQVVRTKSALDVESLAGEAPDWILVDEAAQVSLQAVQRIRTRAAEKRAPIFYVSTMEGSFGWFPEAVTMWQEPFFQEKLDVAGFVLPSWTNTAVYPGGRQDPEILAMEAELPPDVFNERIAGIPSPPKGLVHGAFRMNIHCQPVQFIEGEPVYLGIDPGRSHDGSAYAVVVAQYFDKQLRIIDVVYHHGRTTAEVIEICEGRWWWKKGPINAVIDQAGAQQRSNSALSDVDIWAQQAGVFCRYEYIKIEEGIRRVNGFLRVDPISGRPRLIVNSEDDPDTGQPWCHGLIAEWGGLPSPFGGGAKVYKWESNRDGDIIGGVPRDRYNDASKALAYLICLNFRFDSYETERKTVKIWRPYPVGVA
jgi:hypothetical protein